MSPNKEMPATGLAGLKRHFRQDLMAGFSVSLIALPLSLGIALASGMPPIAGLFTAIVGGMLASRVVGSHVTISGPAAGLIVIVLSAVESLGNGDQMVGYPHALGAIVVAGALVALMGVLRVGKLGDFFPGAAVHGMLAAIGVIIMVKQVYVAMGVAAPKGELLELIAHLPKAAMEVNPEVAIIAGVAIGVLLLHTRIRFKWFKVVPAPLWVLLVSIPMAHIFDLFHEHHYHFAGSDYVLGPKYLVNLPDKIADGIVFPDFSLAGTGPFWVAVTTIALVGALESLLSAKAVDALDPWKRKANLNRDLIGLGGGSALAAAIGGLPMISEIVRSSANINNGARTQWANFFHGACLLIFLLLLSPIIEQIPLSALAAMLIFTGFRLAAPKEFKHMWHIGIKQFVAFTVTMVVVIATDLLIGIAVGILLEFVLHLFTGGSLARTFSAKTELMQERGAVRVRVRQSLTFTNYLSLKAKVLKSATQPRLILDVSSATLIDHTVMCNLPLLIDELRKRDVEMVIEGMQALHSVSGHRLADHTTEKPAKSIRKRLSHRQMEMLILAMERKYQYSPLQHTHMEMWAGFSFLSGVNILKVENLIEIDDMGASILIADISTGSGALLTAAEQTTTYMRIDLEQPVPPDFVLETETVMDRLLEGVKGNDIDFASNKVFSDMYLLRGANEGAIREFFTEERMRFMQQMAGYEIEVSHGVMLVRQRRGVVDAQVVPDMLSAGCALHKVFGHPVEAKPASGTAVA